MNHQGLIVRELVRAAVQNEIVVLASIVRTEGSAYRGVGTRMIIRADDSAAGLVSGGCLEADLVARASTVRNSGRAELVTYDSRSDDDLVWGLGLGCDGLVQVLLEPLAAAEAQQLAALLQTAHQRRSRTIIATSISQGTHCPTQLGARILMDERGNELARMGDWGDADRAAAVLASVAAALPTGRRGTVCDAEGIDVAMESIVPPLDFVICGSGPDVAPVAELGAAQGCNVTVVDHRPVEHAHAERFPSATVVECAAAETLEQSAALTDRTAVVVMSHNYQRDLEYMSAALRVRAPYVGVLGPKRRTERMLGELQARGEAIDDTMLEQLHAPIGLDIGGDGPEAIALSIVAEISAVTNGRNGGFLRDRSAPIHDVLAAPSLPRVIS